jgi:aspartyl-tRNA(Asn)/glutamyl-tRNA(Gln) amidotransferase subunit A
VTDTALVLNALAGFDHLDPGSLEFPAEDFTREIEAGVRGLRIGYVLDDGRGPVESVVKENTMAALDVFAGEGAQLEAATIEGLDEAVDIQHTIVLGELGRTHRDWFAQHEADYGEDVRGYVAEALRLPAIGYVDALQRRRSLQVAFRAAFAPYDAVVTPAGPFTAPPIGQPFHAIDGVEVEVARHLTRFFAAFNLTGQPAIVLPSGFALDGLPTGIQIVTKHGQDALALRIARAFERAAGNTIGVPI